MLRSYRDRHWSPSVAFGRRLGPAPSKLTTGRLVDDWGYQMSQRLPVAQPAAIGNGLGEIPPHRIGRVPGDMRCQHHHERVFVHDGTTRRVPAPRSVSCLLSRPGSLTASSSGSCHQPGPPVIAGAGVQHGGAHRADDVGHPFGDIAQPTRPTVQPPISRTVSPRSGFAVPRVLLGHRGPAPVADAMRPTSAAPRPLPPTVRWRRACWRPRYRSSSQSVRRWCSPRRRVSAQPHPAPQVGARQRPKHFRIRQLPVEECLRCCRIIVGAPLDIEPICFGCK